MPTIKVIELMGVSDKSWDDAAAQALAEASKTIKNISGLDVQDQTAKVRDGKISEYHTTIRLAFRVDGSESRSAAAGGSRSKSSSRSRSARKPAAKKSASKKSAAKTAPRRSRR